MLLTRRFSIASACVLCCLAFRTGSTGWCESFFCLGGTIWDVMCGYHSDIICGWMQLYTPTGTSVCHMHHMGRIWGMSRACELECLGTACTEHIDPPHYLQGGIDSGRRLKMSCLPGRFRRRQGGTRGEMPTPSPNLLATSYWEPTCSPLFRVCVLILPDPALSFPTFPTLGTSSRRWPVSSSTFHYSRSRLLPQTPISIIGSWIVGKKKITRWW